MTHTTWSRNGWRENIPGALLWAARHGPLIMDIELGRTAVRPYTLTHTTWQRSAWRANISDAVSSAMRHGPRIMGIEVDGRLLTAQDLKDLRIPASRERELLWRLIREGKD